MFFHALLLVGSRVYTKAEKRGLNQKKKKCVIVQHLPKSVLFTNLITKIMPSTIFVTNGVSTILNLSQNCADGVVINLFLYKKSSYFLSIQKKSEMVNKIGNGKQKIVPTFCIHQKKSFRLFVYTKKWSDFFVDIKENWSDILLINKKSHRLFCYHSDFL